MVACGQNVYNYNKEGKVVKGWMFNNAGSNISKKPRHYVLGGKDFLIFAEDNGVVNVLNRKGEHRIKLKNKIYFNQYIYLQMGSNQASTRFVSVSSNGYLNSLFLNDNKDSTDLDFDENAQYFSFDGQRMMIAGNNQFSIKDQTQPFQFETEEEITAAPIMKTINESTYFSIPAKNQVYLLDSSGSLLPGFPVYGNGSAAIGNFTNKGTVHIVTSSDDGTLYLYRIIE
jgi:hypothetical protein